MIRVTVELVPHGIEENKQTLEIVEIANVGGSAIRGEYSINVNNKGWSRGTFRHFRQDSVLKLLAIALSFLGHNKD